MIERGPMINYKQFICVMNFGRSDYHLEKFYFIFNVLIMTNPSYVHT